MRPPTPAQVQLLITNPQCQAFVVDIPGKLSDSVPLSTLIGVQMFRFAGAAFLLVAYLGILPGAFASGGYGDVATAMLATVAALLFARGATGGARMVFWAFTLAGLCDLLNVAYMTRIHLAAPGSLGTGLLRTSPAAPPR